MDWLASQGWVAEVICHKGKLAASPPSRLSPRPLP